MLILSFVSYNNLLRQVLSKEDVIMSLFFLLGFRKGNLLTQDHMS